MNLTNLNAYKSDADCSRTSTINRFRHHFVSCKTEGHENRFRCLLFFVDSQPNDIRFAVLYVKQKKHKLFMVITVLYTKRLGPVCGKNVIGLGLLSKPGTQIFENVQWQSEARPRALQPNYLEFTKNAIDQTGRPSSSRLYLKRFARGKMYLYINGCMHS